MQRDPIRDSDKEWRSFRLGESIYKEEARYPAPKQCSNARAAAHTRDLAADEESTQFDLSEMNPAPGARFELSSSVQGPPGAGKTWAGARLIALCSRTGKKSWKSLRKAIRRSTTY